MKRIYAALAAIVLGFGSAIAFSSPAQAAWSDCAAARLCIYDGYSGSGSPYQWTIGYIRGLSNNCLNLTGSQNNTTSSYRLNGTVVGYVVRLHGGANCGGAGQPQFTVTNNAQDSDFRTGSPISGFDNALSSISVRTS